VPNLLPHLTQLVLLDRGQAGVIAYYLDAEQQGVLLLDPDAGQRMSLAESLALVPVEALLKKLDKLVTRDQAPAPCKPRPHRLKVPYAEMVAVRLYYARMLASAGAYPEHRDVLASVLGRFHAPSLALERYIALPSPTIYTR
jgi:hypothetical protein